MENDPIVLNPLDIIIAGLIIFGMMRGAKQGFFKNANRILSIGLAIIIGFRFRPSAESLVQDFFNLNISGEIAAILGFSIAFVIGYILVSTLFGYLTNGLKKVNVSIDNALGAILGGLSATLVLSIAFILLSYINFPSKDNSRGSLLYPYVKDFSRYAVGVGATALREANIQINKYGVGAPPASKDAVNPGPPPTSSDKPSAIR